ncbi:TrkH family potassium uptake protein [Egicoccus sp. AB-alg2]|uniref:TrkH family potassium uptake protein n=1 Tax=Egicoccus sp. AB-alg2 TaxID=3242693 RepID=UPI00359E51B8
MGADARAVAHDLGLLLFVPVGLVIGTVPVAVAVGEWHALPPLLMVAAAAGVCGTLLVRRFRDARTSHAWPAVEIVALGWLLLAVAGAAVLWGIGTAAGMDDADRVFRDPGNALFEAMSGTTSTGLSMADGIESQLSRTVQWWRSLLQWTGGVGVVLFAIGFTHTASNVRALYEAEGRTDDLGGDVRVTVRRTFGIYAGLTAAAVLALLATGHTPWQAVNHGLTGLSTGGFTVTDDSIAGFGTATRVVVMVIMSLGAVTFVGHHVLFVQRDVRRFTRLTPVRVQGLLLAAGLATAVALAARAADLAPADAAFQWVSATATAGFSVAPEQAAWPTPLLLLLVLAMVVGAPSGSTGGGAKQDRVAWLVKAGLARLRHGGRPGQLHWDGDEVAPAARREAVEHAAAVVALWLVTLAIGSALLAATTDAPLRQVVFDAASALGNVGLDAEVVDAELPGLGKGTLAALMYLGRLELLVALTLAAQHEHAT